MFAARAFKKTAGILEAYPKAVESGKELKSVQGIGKGSMDKVCTSNFIECSWQRLCISWLDW